MNYTNTGYMEKQIVSLLSLIDAEEYELSGCKTDPQNDSLYTVSWKKTGPAINTISQLTVSFLFDYGSFVAACLQQGLKPHSKTTLENSFGLFFGELAPYITTFGNDQYLFVHEYIEKRRGTIASHKFGMGTLPVTRFS